MTDLSKRLLDLHAHKDDEDGGVPIDIGCGVAGRDFYEACDESVPALCAEIEDLEKEVETLRRGPTTIMGLSLAEIHELINESFTRRREFKSLRIKDHRK